MIERKYADTKAAKAACAFVEGGWIPDIVPDDAVDIHEVHDLDVNLTWGCFKTQNLAAVRRDLSGLRATKTQRPIARRPSEIFRDFSWWPDTMRSASVELSEFRESPAAPGLDGCVVQVAIHAASGTVCFYRGV